VALFSRNNELEQGMDGTTHPETEALALSLHAEKLLAIGT
jgi:hypothetical protein